VKRILVTDTHLGYKKANDFYLELTFQLFEDIGKYAEENDIKDLIHLGDFFDNRKHMSLKTMFYARRIALNLKKRFRMSYFVLGNHDIFYKDRYLPHSHAIFQSMSHICVVDEPMEISNTMCLIPWHIEGEFGMFGDMSMGDWLNNTDAKYCAGHWEINGAKMNVSGRPAENCNWSFTDFQKFEKTFSGHFHTIGEYNHNVTYLGSPFHMDFNDAGARGWYVFDDETGDLEFVEWNKAPKFVKWNALPDNVYGGEFTGQVVKVIFDQDFGTTVNNQIIQDVQNTNPHQMFVEYAFSTGMNEESIDVDVALMGAEEIHIDFLEKSDLPEHINSDVMEKMVKQLYGELNG
jgi:DNA repair exonuclease SbcCD nuclease subunit